MWVKICANTNVDDALLAVEAGADAVGFVFAASKRQVTAKQVARITTDLPKSVETVGVFSGTDFYEIEHAVASAELTAAQLHGAFDVGLVRRLGEQFNGDLKIIQTVAYAVDGQDDEAFKAAVGAALGDAGVWAVLVDAAKLGVSGGLGVAFDWVHVGGLVRQAGGEGRRVILAGGLRPDTVGEAVREFGPWGVDVASGVEVSPGKKDAAKMREFVAAARRG